MQPPVQSSPRPLWKRALPFLLVGGACNAAASKPWLGVVVAISLLALAFLGFSGRLALVRPRRVQAWLGGAGALTAMMTVSTCMSSSEPSSSPTTSRQSEPTASASALVDRVGPSSSTTDPAVANVASLANPDLVATWAGVRPALPAFADEVAIDVAYFDGTRVVESDARRRASLTSGEGVRVVGRSNMPDGSRLIVSLQGPSFSGQASAETIEGRFVAGPFGPASGPDSANRLPPGRYEVSVTFHTSQSSSVRALIGAEGERLRGRLVRRTSFGRIVEWTGTMTVAGEPPPEFRGAESVRRVERLIAEGRALEGLRRRVDYDLNAAGTCGVRMRAMLVEVEELRAEVARAPAIGNRDALRVRGALGNLPACVSCASNAMRNCTLAEDAVNDR